MGKMMIWSESQFLPKLIELARSIPDIGEDAAISILVPPAFSDPCCLSIVADSVENGIGHVIVYTETGPGWKQQRFAIEREGKKN